MKSLPHNLKPIETLVCEDGTINQSLIDTAVGYDRPPFDPSMIRAFSFRENGSRIQGLGSTPAEALEDLINEIQEALG